MGSLPTNKEQLALQMVNRARLDPQAEMALLFDSDDAEIESAISFFETVEAAAVDQVKSTASTAPLAWNPFLADSADVHNALMIAEDTQSHNLPGEPSLGGRIQDAGYNPVLVGESIYSYARNVLYAHAGFYIDWGYGPDGIQDPAGHRLAMLDPEFTEVGIAFTANNGIKTGPFVTTHHYGRPFEGQDQLPNPILVGVAMDDRDGDAFYDIGEGIGGVTVTAVNQLSGDVFTTTTWASGGYSLKVEPDATYAVSFSGASFGQDQSFVVSVRSHNVARDAIAVFSQVATGATGPTSGDDTIEAQSFGETISLLGGDDAYLGSEGDDFVDGDAGNDVILGRGGNDALFGGIGDDILTGGEGNDLLSGGTGVDTVRYNVEFDAFSFSQTDSGFELTVGSSTDVGSGVEVFQFADETISAVQLAALIEASSPTTEMSTALVGTSGSDLLRGSDANDDFILGGGSLDLALGYGGADAFIFSDEVSNGFAERDVILDFELGVDTLSLDRGDIASVTETGSGLIIYLEGDGDLILLRGSGLSSDDLDLILA